MSELFVRSVTRVSTKLTLSWSASSSLSQIAAGLPLSSSARAKGELLKEWGKGIEHAPV